MIHQSQLTALPYSIIAQSIFKIELRKSLTCLPLGQSETEENKSKSPPHGCKSTNFRNCQFSCPLVPGNRVLKGVSLKIEPGQLVALVVASGCGKSTTISLLGRFYLRPGWRQHRNLVSAIRYHYDVPSLTKENMFQPPSIRGINPIRNLPKHRIHHIYTH